MFFTRLRRHAKWVFVFLALSFRSASWSSSRRLGKRRRHRRASPATAARHRRQHLSSDARAEAAEAPAERASTTGPRDRARGDRCDRRGDHGAERYIEHARRTEDALRELAGLYLARAATPSPRRLRSRSCSRAIAPSARRSPSRSTSATAPRSAPIRSTTRSRRRPQQRSARRTGRRTPPTRARSPPTRSWWRSPRRDPNVQLELAQAAQQSGNTPKAIAAYQRFLMLAPDDPSAPIVKQQIAQLKAAQTPATSG